MISLFCSSSPSFVLFRYQKIALAPFPVRHYSPVSGALAPIACLTLFLFWDQAPYIYSFEYNFGPTYFVFRNQRL